MWLIPGVGADQQNKKPSTALGHTLRNRLYDYLFATKEHGCPIDGHAVSIRFVIHYLVTA
jgi:hypothetical protein